MNSLLLKKKVIGLDISDTSIKIIEARPKNGGVVILNCNSCQLKKDVIVEGEIKNPEALKIVIQNLLDNALPSPIKSQDVCLGIPDYQVFNYFAPRTIIAKDENEFINEIASQNIPIEKNNMLLSYFIETKASELEKNRDLFIFATYKDLVTKWENFFTSINLKLNSVTSSTSAAFFGMDNPNHSDAVCLVDMGRNATSLNILYKNCVIHSSSISNAGRLITQNIANSANISGGKSISEEEAEKIKIEYNPKGVDATNQSIGLFINNTIRTICLNIQASIELCSNTKNICACNIYLLGGSSKLNNLVQFMENFFANSNINLICKNDSPNSDSSVTKNRKTASLDTVAKTVNIQLASGEYISSLNIDSTFLPSHGLVNSYFYKNNCSFNRDQINILLKSNVAYSKKKKKADDEIIGSKKKNSWIKDNSKLVALISIILVGLLLSPFAYAYRKNSNKDKSVDTTLEQPFSVSSNISIRIQASVDDKLYKPGMIKGKIIKTNIYEPVKYEEALREAISLSNLKIKKHEKIWPEPISETGNKEKLIFPLEFEFFLYNENDLSAMVLKEGQERFGQKNFVLSEQKTSRLEYDRLQNKIFLTIKVTFLVNPGIVDKKIAVASSADLQAINNSKGASEKDINERGFDKVSSEVTTVETNELSYAAIINSGKDFIYASEKLGIEPRIIEKFFPDELYTIISTVFNSSSK